MVLYLWGRVRFKARASRELPLLRAAMYRVPADQWLACGDGCCVRVTSGENYLQAEILLQWLYIKRKPGDEIKLQVCLLQSDSFTTYSAMVVTAPDMTLGAPVQCDPGEAGMGAQGPWAIQRLRQQLDAVYPPCI